MPFIPEKMKTVKQLSRVSRSIKEKARSQQPRRVRSN
jgi:hypothetical protein